MGSSDSKLQLQSAVLSLQKTPQGPDSELWEKLFSLPQSADDIFSFLTPQEIREVIRTQPKNLTTLISKAIEKLQLPPTSPKSTLQVLNALRLLTRVLPLIFETDHKEMSESLFWSSSQSSEEDTTRSQTQSFLGATLIDDLIQLLFTPSFTLPPETKDSNLQQILWTGGIVFNDFIVSPYTNHALASNRIEVLRCLVACFSHSLFVPPKDVATGNNFLTRVCSGGPMSRALFYSLLNTAISYDPVGWGVPYNHIIFSDPYEVVANLSLQILLILLDYSPITKSERTLNVFRGYFDEINKAEDFHFIYSSIQTLLTSPLLSSNTYLPNSKKYVGWYEELMMFFWSSLNHNKTFFKYVVEHENLNSVVGPILHYMFESRKDPAHNGLIHLSSFICLLLSGERQFSIGLNQPMKPLWTITVPVFSGSYADYLIIVLSTLILEGLTQLEALYDCFLTIISNISPYVNCSLNSAIHLIRLFAKLSQPSFLLQKERNHRFVFFLLETFNNIIQYQYQGNHHLVYAMIRNAHYFSSLESFNLEAFLEKKKKKSEGQSTEVVEISQSSESTGEKVVAASPQSSSTNVPLETVATIHPPASSNEAWKPSQEWFDSWHSKLPIKTITQLLQYLVPKVSQLISGSAADGSEILDFLSKTTLVGVLPVPHRIIVRKYQENLPTLIWFTTYLWGVIYVRSSSPPLFYGTDIRLFVVAES